MSIDAAVSNLYYGADKRPATPMLKPGYRPFPPRIAPGGSASAVLLYSVPKADRDVVTLEVNLDNELRTIEFKGGCPRLC